MARRNAAASGESGEGGESGATETPAAKKGPGFGYRRTASVSDAPWVAQEKGNVCEGKVLGRYEMNVEPVRYYYQIELIKACLVRQGTGDEAETIEVPAGTVVNLNENFKIKSLTERVVPEILAGAEYNVFVEYGDKRKLKGSAKTMWEVEIFDRQIKAPTRAPVALPKESLGSAEGAPF